MGAWAVPVSGATASLVATGTWADSAAAHIEAVSTGVFRAVIAAGAPSVGVASAEGPAGWLFTGSVDKGTTEADRRRASRFARQRPFLLCRSEYSVLYLVRSAGAGSPCRSCRGMP